MSGTTDKNSVRGSITTLLNGNILKKFCSLGKDNALFRRLDIRFFAFANVYIPNFAPVFPNCCKNKGEHIC